MVGSPALKTIAGKIAGMGPNPMYSKNTDVDIEDN